MRLRSIAYPNDEFAPLIKGERGIYRKPHRYRAVFENPEALLEKRRSKRRERGIFRKPLQTSNPPFLLYQGGEFKGCFILIFLAAAYFLISCANVVAPTGGEVDKTPPQILASDPIQRATNVHPTSISLTFNTFIAQRDRVQQSLSLTPPLKTDYAWFGKTLLVNFREPLDSNTTVSLTLGTDYTNWDGNKPEAAYTLIFATGGKLDSGTIRGTLEQFGIQSAQTRNDGVMAFLYPLGGGINPDTLNPAHTKPKYKLPLGSKGTFEFSALAQGAYRLFAVKDEFRNEVIDAGTDAVGTTTRDISLPEGGTADVRLQLAPKADLTPPAIFDVRHISPKRVLVRWSEKVEGSSLQNSTRGAWMLEDSAGILPRTALPHVLGLHPEATNPAATVLYLDAPLETSARRWRLRTTSTVRDSAGNVLPDSARTVYFSSNSNPSQADTVPPSLVRTVLWNAPRTQRFSANAPNLPDSARGLPLQPQIALLFSSAMAAHTVGKNTSSTSNGAVLQQEALKEIERNIVLENAQQQPIPLRVIAETQAGITQANMLLLEPRTPLAPNAWYSLGFQASLLKAWNGAPVRDSVVIVRFQTADPRDFGAVSGTFTDSLLLPPTTATLRLNASNDGILTTMATSTRIASNASVLATAAILTTNGQYIIVLEASQNLASQNPAPQNPSSQSSPTNSVPARQDASNQGLSPFAEARYEFTLRTRTGKGAWNFAALPPGTYSLSVFYDANGNGVYDYGTTFPYAPAERFHKATTDVQIRARWTIENVAVGLP